MAECSTKDFIQTYDYLYGNCYKFNSKQNNNTPELLKSTKAGKINGLRLEILIPATQANLDFETSYGAHIYIHNDSINTNFFEGIDISTGAQSDIAVNRLFINREPKPYSDCIADLDTPESYDSFIFKEVFKDQSTYRERDCHDLCFQELLIKKCGCHIPGLGNLGSETPCISVNQTKCSFDAATHFYSVGIKLICGEKCPTECNKQYFSYSKSFANYPTKAYAERLMRKKHKPYKSI